jgi:hypothetical protein
LKWTSYQETKDPLRPKTIPKGPRNQPRYQETRHPSTPKIRKIRKINSCWDRKGDPSKKIQDININIRAFHRN